MFYYLGGDVTRRSCNVMCSYLESRIAWLFTCLFVLSAMLGVIFFCWLGGMGGQAQVLYAAAILAHEFLGDKERVAPRPLIDTAVYLHDILLSLQGLHGDALQVVIAKVLRFCAGGFHYHGSVGIHDKIVYKNV